MKQRVFLVIAFLFSVLTTGCETTARDGDWDPMKWEKTSYQLEKNDNGAKAYVVPKEGATYKFTCKNYKSFWLSPCDFIEYGYGANHKETVRPDYENDPRHLSYEWCDISVEENVITIVFHDGQHSLRSAQIGVTAGDIFHTFNFIQ